MYPKLGQILKDKHTGFTGVATSRIQYENGCVSYLLEPKFEKGKVVEAQWFDAHRVIPKGELVVSDPVLGTVLTDKVTGFVGSAVARIDHENGTVRYSLSPKVDKDGKLADPVWFDEQRVVPSSKVKTGGPGPVPRSCDPKVN